ncbi:gfo/Idh/MocA family oxidoreductase [Clostridiales bacterium COT073_COT-073]|nr:gfo/Idh/MocA family oxidoreductase [Clostridiales bacterium COT073_COT-073]
MLRFGVVGTNTITDEFIRCGKQIEGFVLSAVYSRTMERAREYVALHEAEHCFDNLEEMVRSDVIDAVYIASPTSFHADQSILSMCHGKHVLCEKPMASNCREVEEMIRTARENKVLLMEAMKSLFLPNFQALIQELPRIGKVRRYYSQFCKYSSRYDRFLSGEKVNAFQPEFSNGSLMDLGVYCIQPLIALFGMPKAMKANAVKLRTGVDGEGSLILTYDELEAVLVHSKISVSGLQSEIQGEKGSLMIDMISKPSKIIFYGQDGQEIDVSRPQKPHMVYEIEEFIDLVKQGKTESSVMTYQQSLNTMKILEEARRQTGIVFPADK